VVFGNMDKLRKFIREVLQEQKRDRCLRIADRKYDKPSAYKSGAVVRCRKGDIWEDLKENDLNSIYPKILAQTEKDALEIVYKNWDKFGGKECNSGFCDIFAQKLSKHLPGSKIMSTEDDRGKTFGHVWVEYKGRHFDAETPNGVFSWKRLPWMIDFYKNNKEYPSDIEILKEDESLHKWFKRSGAPGKTGGWVDCNAPIRKDGKVTGYKPCGRKEGEKRAKYPACRPTAARCKDKGKGKTWGKTK
jgi:hypothetical protein